MLQFDEENPFVLISSALLVQPDEGVSVLVVDRIGDKLPQSTEKSRILVIPVGARHKCQQACSSTQQVVSLSWFPSQLETSSTTAAFCFPIDHPAAGSNAIVGVVTTGFECLPPSCDGLTGPDDHGPMISRLIDRGVSGNQAGPSGSSVGRSPHP
ncbi:hypothetical protein F511_17520 [Dorcoceras hygrometricum]|uniref:Uncharacterized protein n=1 Tax=Dorcoceras hygrometricum TaxID=472368 RepID=A0A2Z7CNS5_9LAMI|nr:hypothetical protein F511_17520 [Dorcoceras hygrometricum]